MTPGLPIITDITHLAYLLHVSVPFLIDIHSNILNEYYTKNIPKKSGGVRVIEAPSVKLKGIQAWILRNILDKVVASPYSTAYRKGCSIVDNANPHQNGLFFLSFDLKNFFPSIWERRIVGIFSSLGYSKIVSQFLAHLCTFRGHLPQGAVTSPALSNMAAYHLDYRLGGYAGKKNMLIHDMRMILLFLQETGMFFLLQDDLLRELSKMKNSLLMIQKLISQVQEQDVVLLD